MTIKYYSTLITLSVWPNHQSLVSRTILQGQKVITLDVYQFFLRIFRFGLQIRGKMGEPLQMLFSSLVAAVVEDIDYLLCCRHYVSARTEIVVYRTEDPFYTGGFPQVLLTGSV